jgi:hypothetical protein
VPLDNPTTERFNAVVSLFAAGDGHWGSLGDVVKAPETIPVEPTPVFTLPISVNRSPSSYAVPNHYVGDVQLRAGGAEPIVKIPLEVNVRAGPLLALIVLVIGVFLGQAVKFMNTRGKDQSDLLSRFNRLEAHISLSPGDHQLLDAALDDVRLHIYEMRLDDAKTELSALEKRWNLLTAWRRFEATLQPRANEEAVSKILMDIQRGRTLIALKRDDDATTLANEVESAIVRLGPAPPPIAHQFHVPAPAEPGLWRWDRLWPGFRAQLTLRVLRPLLALLLTAALVALGLSQLYLKNATFGSDPFMDYFGLLVWGMSSDVAGRTLASLKS